MKLVGFLMERDERSKGNLTRCLENLQRYCDEIVVYDDGSVDGSLDIVRQYTDHFIVGPGAGLSRETEHRQQLLDLALTLDPDYVFWLDADEVLDRRGTEGGLRADCETSRGAAYEFEEVTLWRSQSWRRLDYLGSGWFKRLWNVRGREPHIPQAQGLHRQLFPNGVGPAWLPSTYRVLHYGYATKAAIELRWRERTAYGVPANFRRKCIDEQTMRLERVPLDWYPVGCEPPRDEAKPEPIRYAEDIMEEAGL